MADKRTEPPEGTGKADPQPSVGSLLIEARKRRGLSSAEVVRETRIPAHYVRMIESDDYRLIADQLYLLPFLRRYAVFVGLDSEELASRFLRDIQRADTYAARMSEPIPVVRTRTARTWIATMALAATLTTIALVYLAKFDHPRRSAAPRAEVSPPAVSSAAAGRVVPAPASSAASTPSGASRALSRKVGAAAIS